MWQIIFEIYLVFAVLNTFLFWAGLIIAKQSDMRELE